ncbi:cobaltochelatase subunit CobN [Dialister sp.]|uniref:cobaltochelatase subunit CobN n=1 Tax=Dialister sp. TaxID=1955814 RepID=UPI003F0FE1A7
MNQVLYITNMESVYSGIKQAVEEMENRTLAPAVFQIGDDEPWSEVWNRRVRKAPFILILWMGTGLSCDFLKKIYEVMKTGQVPFLIRVTDLEPEKESGGLTEAQKSLIKKYIACGGIRNWENLLLYISNTFQGQKTAFEEPHSLPYWGIYVPGSREPIIDIRFYMNHFCDSSKPVVGLIFSREDWLWNHLEWQEEMIKAVKKEGCSIVPVFTTSTADPASGVPGLSDNMKECFYLDGKVCIDVLLNPFLFSLTAAGFLQLEDLRRLGVPLLQLYNTYRDYQWWSQSLAGLTPNELSYAVALPEFDGVIHTVPVSTLEEREDGTHYHKPIPERIAMVARRAKKWAALSHKSAKDKKIAIIFHNFPADNSHIGSASNLDSIESIRRLLALLKDKGYTVDHVPETAQELIDTMTKHATNDRRFISETLLKKADGKITADDYRNFYEQLPKKTQEHLLRDWGDPPGEIFRYEDSLIVPGMLDGNIFLTVQPPRGFGEDPGKIYHSPDLAPTHQYQGFYEWIRNVWKADAMIHVGTHGNLEWLPGKGVAMSNSCYPDINTGDVPDIYPYWITCVGEGIQAKRRSASCLISYLTAPMSLAGTYDEYDDLEKNLEEYCHFKNDEEEKASLEEVKDLIRKSAVKCHVDDIREAECESFDDYVGRLHNFITDLKNMQISVGLHVMGEAPAGEELIEYLFALTKLDNGKIPSLLKTLASAYGHDYYELLQHSAQMTEDGTMTYGMLLDRLSQKARDILQKLYDLGFDEKKAESIFLLPWTDEITNRDKRDSLLSVSRYICTDIAPHLSQTTLEMENTLRALDGKYVDPSPSGAPTSGGADLLPTGRNFYSIDPRALPTEAAWHIGCQMAENVIQKYILEEGTYPESCGIILWATSNLRNHGTCIAEFLALMGLKPVWQPGSHRVTGVKVIPLSELKRPRIDVTGRISGLFRDSLPASVSWLDEAASMVSRLDEPEDMNFVRKHVLEDVEDLKGKGIGEKEAWRQASYRIFGDPPGCHGAGVNALLDAKNWENVDDIAFVYTRWGGHAYGKGSQGVYMPDLFKKRMAGIDITIQNVDQRESSMLSSDDYNSYRGGMVAAVRSYKGAMPKNYVNDSSDTSRVVIRTLDEELKRWFRGEAANPKYIKGMKKHGYKGAGDLAEYVAVSFQWDATSEVMEDWMYDTYADSYALNQEMQEWMKSVNPWALERIVETLLEAHKRNMWHTTPERLRQLEELCLEVEGELEEAGNED